MANKEVTIIYRLTGYPLREGEADLPPRVIDLTHVPLYELQKIFHAGPANRMLERRFVNDEKALCLQSYCSESLNTADYRWEFAGHWSDAEI